MNLASNFLANPFGKLTFLVDKYTRSPSTKGAILRRLLASRVCLTRAASTLSCAAISASLRWSAKFRTEGYSSVRGWFHIMERGIRPVLRKNGANPVLTDRAELIANSIEGNLDTQFVCLSLMHCLSICVTVRFARSVDPSVSG